ncbi:MAG: YqgE/AlgH family protein [Chitinophagaceae bacterium]|jgi:putative transcriptional regulator|nr:YqgE/AlgH family protein [Chitinophagaceae bacterium]
MIEPAPGILLISDPFLKDPNFMRTAVFLCEHTADGSFGFVLNRPYEQRLDEFIPDLEGFRIPVFYGGPVQPDTLHFLHNIPELRSDAQAVLPNVYWGGNFEQIIQLIRDRQLDLDNIRFYLGYSGWSGGQLEDELASSSWLTAQGSHQLVFRTPPGEVWKRAVMQLDEAFHPIVNYPIDPQLN